MQKIKYDQYIFEFPKYVRDEMNRTGKFDLSYKPRHSFSKIFGSQSGKDKKSLIEEVYKL